MPMIAASEFRINEAKKKDEQLAHHSGRDRSKMALHLSIHTHAQTQPKFSVWNTLRAPIIVFFSHFQLNEMPFVGYGLIVTVSLSRMVGQVETQQTLLLFTQTTSRDKTFIYLCSHLV